MKIEKNPKTDFEFSIKNVFYKSGFFEIVCLISNFRLDFSINFRRHFFEILIYQFLHFWNSKGL